MSTIDSREIIEQMLRNDGRYETDPRAYSIWSYHNDYGKLTQAVFWDAGHGVEFVHSPHIHAPKLLWMRDSGLTVYGQEWLENKPSEEEKIRLKIHCSGCSELISIEVNRSGYEKWRSGTLIQRAFPEMSPDQRELLISGTCPECWKKIFSEVED